MGHLLIYRSLFVSSSIMEIVYVSFSWLFSFSFLCILSSFFSLGFLLLLPMLSIFETLIAPFIPPFLALPPLVLIVLLIPSLLLPLAFLSNAVLLLYPIFLLSSLMKPSLLPLLLLLDNNLLSLLITVDNLLKGLALAKIERAPIRLLFLERS